MARIRYVFWSTLVALLTIGCDPGGEPPEPEPPPPEIVSFTATPDEVDEGEEVVLAWETAQASPATSGPVSAH